MKIKNHALLFLFTLSLFIGFSYLRFREVKSDQKTQGFIVNPERQVLSETSENENPSDQKVDGLLQEKVQDSQTQTTPTTPPQSIEQKIEIKNDVQPGADETDMSPSINDFYYPDAFDAGSTTDQINLRSPDHPNKITDWYKTKIKDLGLNVNSFVTTSANDQILNKLSAASSSLEINVEISKDQQQTLTDIKVSIGN